MSRAQGCRGVARLNPGVHSRARCCELSSLDGPSLLGPWGLQGGSFSKCLRMKCWCFCLTVSLCCNHVRVLVHSHLFIKSESPLDSSTRHLLWGSHLSSSAAFILENLEHIPPPPLFFAPSWPASIFSFPEAHLCTSRKPSSPTARQVFIYSLLLNLRLQIFPKDSFSSWGMQNKLETGKGFSGEL